MMTWVAKPTLAPPSSSPPEGYASPQALLPPRSCGHGYCAAFSCKGQGVVVEFLLFLGIRGSPGTEAACDPQTALLPGQR